MRSKMRSHIIRFKAIFLTFIFILGLATSCGKNTTGGKKRDAFNNEGVNQETKKNVDGTTEKDFSNLTEEDQMQEGTKDSKPSGNSSKNETTKNEEDTSKVSTRPISQSKGENQGGRTIKSENTFPEDAKVDLKGYTIKIAAWWNIDPKTSGNVYYEKAVEREEKVRKKYNIKIKYISVPGQDLRDKISSSVMAGDPIGDILRCRSGWVLPTLAGKGYIEPADKYFDVSDPLWNPYVLKQAVYKGRVMGVNHGPLSSYACMLYNRSMMQRLGLADPQTLVQQKKWTWAKFEEYVKAIAVDSNNDGKLDIYGTNEVSFQSAVASNGGRIVSDIDGKDYFTLNRPEAVEALKWVQKINTMGVAGGTMADFAMGNIGFYWWWNYEWGFKNTMQDKWGILPVPMGPRAKDYAAWWDEVHLMCIPANSKYPKEAAAIWTDLSRWYPGVSGRDQMYQDMLENQYLDKRDIEMAKFISTKFWLDKCFAYTEILDDMYPWPDNGTGIKTILRGSGSKTIEQWLAEKSGKYQNIIDQLWQTFE